ncbi:NADH:flavin oxidoreductase [Clostridium sp. 'deep sea']|uniref:NADH:flavin oxidoreductase n=1 Tax=Clostridium sp. 'deep sea' TaxID=2779445 RepID=UPI0018966E13|nr:NADH:flavin oxidoreductase [Clostridium sp. 'deep sea']QOR36471.1 NADH:flavin oxidoreductase [Clostridium sp. 'deep sea']
MKTLFDKTSFNSLELKNRLVRSATWERMANEDGTVNDSLVNVYKELAEGGVGLIITGYAFVTEHEQPNPKMLGISHDKFIPGLKKLTKVVHNYDSKIILQIAYGGSQTSYKVENRIIWGPSAVRHPRSGITPVEMKQKDIDELIKSFALAAKRAQEAGFDGVQIHGAHGYLLSQFLSPFFNKRQDLYGGSLTNRMRIICEIYEEMRAEVGSQFNILIKINCSDFMQQGFTFNESKEVCGRLANLGINAIEISGGNDPSVEPNQESVFAKYACNIAESCKVPIIVVNKNRDPKMLTKILNTTNISYFSMSRALICQPNLANIWMRGEFTKSMCISCNKCFRKDGIKCIFSV